MEMLPKAKKIEIVKNYEFRPILKIDEKIFRIKKSVIFTLSFEGGTFMLNIDDTSTNKTHDVELLTFLDWQKYSFHPFKTNFYLNLSELFEMCYPDDQHFTRTLDQSLFKHIAERISISITCIESGSYEVTLTIRGTQYVASQYVAPEDFLPFIE